MKMFSVSLASCSICSALLVGAPASAQQFSQADYRVMQRICDPHIAGNDDKDTANLMPQGLPCIYDGKNKIIGLATAQGLAVRRIGGTWYLMLYSNVGFAVGAPFLFSTPDCTGTPYLSTGNGQKVGSALVENSPFFAQSVNNQIVAPVGTPTQIKARSEGGLPPSTVCSQISSEPTITVRPAVAIDQSPLEPPFSEPK